MQAKNMGQMSGDGGPDTFAVSSPPLPGKVEGIGGGSQDLGDRSGFKTSGYIDKKGTPYGEAAKFNFLPPGMEISDQEMIDMNPMPMKKVVDGSYPGDGY